MRALLSMIFYAVAAFVLVVGIAIWLISGAFPWFPLVLSGASALAAKSFDDEDDDGEFSWPL